VGCRLLLLQRCLLLLRCQLLLPLLWLRLPLRLLQLLPLPPGITRDSRELQLVVALGG
jgi:hypothetical protein